MEYKVKPKKEFSEQEKLTQALNSCVKCILLCHNNPYKLRKYMHDTLELAYALGVADGQDAEIYDKRVLIPVEKDKYYSLNCPYCGEEIEVDVLGMCLKDDGEIVVTGE